MNQLLDAEITNIDDDIYIRPQQLSDYVGQSAIKENLDIFMKAAKARQEPLDHLLLYGPPGLGKTTLAYIVAHEMEGNLKSVSGPAIEKQGDLAAILSSLEPGDVLFIDEIHRIPKVIEEILYPAMEDFFIDVVVGSDVSVRSVRLDLPPFTLVGATTRVGDLSAPLRDRFGIVSKLEYYTQNELEMIVSRTSTILDCHIDEQAVGEIAKRSRGTPRIANRLLRRVRDFAQILNDSVIDYDLASSSLTKLKVDELGLDDVDINYLIGIIERFDGGPVGIGAIAASISEEALTLEDVYEPYLLQIGFINRTSQGRVVTNKAYEHLKKQGRI